MHVVCACQNHLGWVRLSPGRLSLTLLCCGANPHEPRYQARLAQHNPNAPLLLYHSPGAPLDT